MHIIILYAVQLEVSLFAYLPEAQRIKSTWKRWTPEVRGTGWVICKSGMQVMRTDSKTENETGIKSPYFIVL